MARSRFEKSPLKDAALFAQAKVGFAGRSVDWIEDELDWEQPAVACTFCAGASRLTRQGRCLAANRPASPILPVAGRRTGDLLARFRSSRERSEPEMPQHVER